MRYWSVQRAEASELGKDKLGDLGDLRGELREQSTTEAHQWVGHHLEKVSQRIFFSREEKGATSGMKERSEKKLGYATIFGHCSAGKDRSGSETMTAGEGPQEKSSVPLPVPA